MLLKYPASVHFLVSPGWLVFTVILYGLISCSGCNESAESTDPPTIDQIVGNWKRVYSTFTIKDTNTGTLVFNRNGTYQDNNGLGLAYKVGNWKLSDSREIGFAASGSNPLLTENRLFKYRIEFLNRKTILISRAQAVFLAHDPISPTLTEGGPFYNWPNSDIVLFKRPVN